MKAVFLLVTLILESIPIAKTISLLIELSYSLQKDGTGSSAIPYVNNELSMIAFLLLGNLSFFRGQKIYNIINFISFLLCIITWFHSIDE